MNYFAEKLSRLVPLLVLAGFLVVAGCDADTEANAVNDEEEVSYEIGDPIEDPSLAVIVSSEYGTDTLRTEEFNQQFEQIRMQAPQYGLGPDQEGQMRRILVESFVGQHVLEGEAQARDLEVDSAMIEMQLDQARAQFEDEEQFQEMLEREGLTEEDARGFIADQMRQQMLQEELAGEAAEPTEEELEEFREGQAAQIRARHILFRTEGEDDEAVRQRAQAVLDSVKAGEDFEELARRHGEDGTAEEGGDLGYFSRDRMVEPFADAAFALSDSGDVADELVETDFGYHIIQKTGERRAEPMAEEQARQMMMQQRRGEAVEAGFERLRAKATVRINPDVVEDVDLTQPPVMPR